MLRVIGELYFHFKILRYFLNIDSTSIAQLKKVGNRSIYNFLKD